MQIHRSNLHRLALSTILLVLPTASAYALDADAFGNRLKAVFAAQGAEIGWSNLTESGTQIVLEGVTFGMGGQPQKTNIGNVTLDNVTEENGGYKIGTLALQDYSATEDGMTIGLSGISMTGLVVPAENSADPLSSMLMYSNADLEKMSVKKGDKEVFSLDQLHFEISPPGEGKPMEFSGSTEKFSAELSETEDPQSKAVIEALGYQHIDGDIEINGSWDPADGSLEFSQYDITVDNAGTFGMTFNIGGYTAAFIKQMQDMQKQMAAQPAGADSSAQGMAMLGLMQQLTFESASLRWDDDSLTKKVIDFTAASQGAKPEDIIAGAKGSVPLVMGMLNNPELTLQVTEAINKYLDDPKSFEISAEPESPVPFAVIMAGAMSSAPQDLVKTLAVTVSANED